MANRYFSGYPDHKIASEKTLPPNGRREGNPNLPQEKQINRGGKGFARSDRGHGMPLVKTFISGEYMKGNPGMMRGQKNPPKAALKAALSEVFTNEPSTVKKAGRTAAQQRKQKIAIAFSKARAAQ